MLYFIAWVILMLAAILAVPIVSMLEKRKLEGPREKKKKKKKGEDEALADDDETSQPQQESDEETPEEGAVEESEAIPDDSFGSGVPDDFSAFEEEFK